MDLNVLNISIQYKGTILKLYAKFSREGRLKFISGASLQKHYSKWKVGVMPQLTSLCDVPTNMKVVLAIEKVLQHFNIVFEEPKGLPPVRAQDHHIHLQPNIASINVRPYRYPHIQKIEIKKKSLEKCWKVVL